MKLQYFVSVKAETEELKYLLKHKKPIGLWVYESKLPDGRKARLKMEGYCVYVYY